MNTSELLDKLEQATEVNKVAIGFMHSLQSYILSQPKTEMSREIWGMINSALIDIDAATGVEVEKANDFTDTTQAA